jgi:hypothetical protein
MFMFLLWIHLQRIFLKFRRPRPISDGAIYGEGCLCDCVSIDT